MEDTEVSLDGLPLAERISKMHELIMAALDKVYDGSFMNHRAERFAALSLRAQMDLAKFLSQVEFNAKQAKSDVKYLTGELNFEFRNGAEKKITEEALKQLINKDERIKQADLKQAEIEREANQWKYIFDSLKDAHIFFRNLGKI